MALVKNWKRVLRRAWSIRLILIAGMFSGLEVALPYLEQSIGIPRGCFAILSMLVVGGAFVSRLIAQKGVSDE